MELTPKVFRDVQFREKLRGGYHPEDVDEFLEQAAQAVDALHEQLRQATESAQRAQQAAAEASTTDDTLKRMLLIAQRTADQAVNEAHQEADHLLAESRSQAASMLADAEERGRRAYESGLAEGRASMEKVDEALRQARHEVEVLRAWVDQHKDHLLSVLREAQSLVEGAGFLTQPPVPGLSAAVPDVFDAGDHFAGVTEGASAHVAEVDRPDPSEDATGEWDPNYLRGLDSGAEDPLVGSDQDVTQAEVPLGEGPDQAAATVVENGPRHAPDDDAMALDERALDTFFSDQDMGEARGLGRFRRRQ